MNNTHEPGTLAKGFGLSDVIEEIRDDPWLLGALGVGTTLSLGFFTMHACCFGAEAMMLKSLSVICSTAV